jgi:hypothetical protein
MDVIEPIILFGRHHVILLSVDPPENFCGKLRFLYIGYWLLNIAAQLSKVNMAHTLFSLCIQFDPKPAPQS